MLNLSRDFPHLAEFAVYSRTRKGKRELVRRGENIRATLRSFRQSRGGALWYGFNTLTDPHVAATRLGAYIAQTRAQARKNR